MKTIYFYVACYGVSFLLGCVFATVAIYYLTQQQYRRQAILEKRIKQLRRDARL
jgi:hypothetical protein